MPLPHGWAQDAASRERWRKRTALGWFKVHPTEARRARDMAGTSEVDWEPVAAMSILATAAAEQVCCLVQHTPTCMGAQEVRGITLVPISHSEPSNTLERRAHVHTLTREGIM